MKLNIAIGMLALALSVAACEVYKSPEINQGLDEETDNRLYSELYEPIADKGQYYLPQMKRKPKKYWSCVEVVGVGSRNEITQTETMRGLQYHLLCQSMAGLTNLAVEEGRSDIAVWLHDHSDKASYKECKRALGDMGISEQGMQSGLELACNNYGPADGVAIQLKDLFDGYVLTDVCGNPESAVVAAVASHVYNALIVDVRDRAYYEAAGYTLKYDATQKTTAQAWAEFKDRCSNEALVIMPAQTGELREFAIKNRLFVLNLNRDSNHPEKGKNTELLKEILAWLKPDAPVLGWEQQVGEDEFVGPVSASGHPMIPCDWSYNHSLTSLLYTERQESVLAKVSNPQFIDFDRKKNYVSFFLSDGDNVQWMMQDFASEYYNVPEAGEVNMTYGLPLSTLSMLAPSWCKSLMEMQRPDCSLMEMLGGGYYYVDTYGSGTGRDEHLRTVAQRLAAHMRQHRVKLLGVMAMDVKSEAAREAFQAYVDANDQLEGIIALQYAPYAGGEGEVYWVTNQEGYDIPVITVRYSIWDRTHAREGSPEFVAGRLQEEAAEESFSAVCVHAWSNFDGAKGAAAAKQCADRLDERFEVVNMQELVWRLRMSQRPEQTQEYLNKVF